MPVAAIHRDCGFGPLTLEYTTLTRDRLFTHTHRHTVIHIQLLWPAYCDTYFKIVTFFWFSYFHGCFVVSFQRNI